MREIDIRISEEVMGCEVFSIGGDPNTTGLQEARTFETHLETRNLPHYSSDFNYTLEVIEEINKYNLYQFSLELKVAWEASFSYKHYDMDDYPLYGVDANASHPAMATCLAALEIIKEIEELIEGWKDDSKQNTV